jgi:hypothetical protein
MYSGSTLTAASGRVLGAHQKIDRKARKHLEDLLPPGTEFPDIRRILHFEGHNGPDAIKRKSPAKDEPWHYFNPFDDADTLLLELIQTHYDNLIGALVADDIVVASFEAAWLAHAVVDGLTPAHHYPYEEKLDELRGGLGKETRVSFKDKVLLPGDSRRHFVSNNWKFWGPKGLFTTHFAFEWGVSTILLTMSLGRSTMPGEAELVQMQHQPLEEYFRMTAKEVAALGLYDKFYKTGWTIALARQVRQQLVPVLIKSVALVWYRAAYEAHSQSVGSTGTKDWA